jgi:hypothetical protein
MVWINPHPLEDSYIVGPWSSYSAARATDIIGASLDPIAMDYWIAKHVLMPTAEYLNYTEYTSLDPDNATIHQNLYHGHIMQDESFHNYLERSMNELGDAGFQVTMNETEMNVFVSALVATTPVTPTTPTDTPQLGPLPIAVGVIALMAVVVGIVIFKKRT